MLKSKLFFTLEISLANTSLKASSVSAAEGLDWLENDRPEILAPLQKTGLQEEGSMINDLATPESTHIYKTDHMSLRQTELGFQLVLPNDVVLLKNGDLIQLGNTLLRVNIKKEHIVPSEKHSQLTQGQYVSEPMKEDIWSAPMNSGYGAQRSLRTLDPFALSAKPRYPTPTSRSLPRLSPPVIQKESNILTDLGMPARNTLLTHRPLSGNKTTFSEQSPMDRIDEYLNEESTMTRRNYTRYEPPATPLKPEKPSGGFIGFLKKLAS